MDPIQPTKKGIGRKKIEIKRIQKEEKRQVCFSKRRKGLFKKASELCTLCGAEVAIVVFSLAGKPYYFGHPSADHVLCRFLEAPTNSDMFQAQDTSCSEQMSQELAYLRDKLEAEMRRHEELEEALKASWPLPKPFCWDSDVNSMGIEEMKDYGNVLRQLQDMVAQASQQNCFQAAEQSCLFQAEQETCFQAEQETCFHAEQDSCFQAEQETCFQAAEQSCCFQAAEEAMWGIDSLLVAGGGEDQENYFLWQESCFQAVEQEGCFQASEQEGCFQAAAEEAMWGIEDQNYFLCLEEQQDIYSW